MSAASMRGKSQTKTIAVIDYIIENLKEPVFVQTTNALEDTFNINNDDVLQADKITLYMLNVENQQLKNEDSPSRFFFFYRACRDFLPKKYRNALKTNYKSSLSYDTMCQATKEKYAEFNEWYEKFKENIEIQLTQNYYMSGQKRFEFLLERRFRKSYGVNKEMTVETSNNNADNNLIIKFTEA